MYSKRERGVFKTRNGVYSKQGTERKVIRKHGTKRNVIKTWNGTNVIKTWNGTNERIRTESSHCAIPSNTTQSHCAVETT